MICRWSRWRFRVRVPGPGFRVPGEEWNTDNADSTDLHGLL